MADNQDKGVDTPKTSEISQVTSPVARIDMDESVRRADDILKDALADGNKLRQELQERRKFVPEGEKDSFLAHEERADFVVGKLALLARGRSMPYTEETRAIIDKELEDHERAWKAKWDAIKEEHRKEKAEKPCPHADGH